MRRKMSSYLLSIITHTNQKIKLNWIQQITIIELVRGLFCFLELQDFIQLLKTQYSSPFQHFSATKQNNQPYKNQRKQNFPPLQVEYYKTTFQALSWLIQFSPINPTRELTSISHISFPFPHLPNIKSSTLNYTLFSHTSPSNQTKPKIHTYPQN